MRWEAWPFVIMYVYGILSSAVSVGKERKPLTEGVAVAAAGVSLVLLWLMFRLGGVL